MLEFMLNIDHALMRFFNNSLANPAFDLIMPVITDDWFVRIFFVTFALLAAVFGGKYGRVTFLLLILAVILTDQISSQVLKPWVGRLRPCKTMDLLHVLVDCSSGKSFPSSHAANSFGQAVIWCWRYPKYKWLFILSAVIISYSRVAVGVHYPLDVLAGAILGTLCALLIFFIMRQTGRLLSTGKALDNKDKLYIITGRK